MLTKFENPYHRTGAWMLLVEIISYLYGHIAINHETVALVCGIHEVGQIQRPR